MFTQIALQIVLTQDKDKNLPVIFKHVTYKIIGEPKQKLTELDKQILRGQLEDAFWALEEE